MIDLKPFCAEPGDHWYYKLSEPWSEWDYTYASNGRILVQVLRVLCMPDIPERPDAPKINPGPLSDTLANMPSTWLPIPAFDPPTWEVCDDCLGTGECEREDSDDLSCDYCHGKGMALKGKPIEMGGVFYDSLYLTLIKDLPGIEIAPGDACPGNMTGGGSWPYYHMPARFRFSGGCGLLMPRFRSGGCSMADIERV